MKTTCPLCNINACREIGIPKRNKIAQKFIDKDYYVVQCENCEFYYISPTISFTEDQWAQLYNVEYFDFQSDWLLRKRSIELKQRFDKALGYLANKDEVRFLDIGAGEGKALVEGIERGWDVTGIDIVDNRRELAKDKSITFVKDKFLEHDFPDDYFDVIYLDSVLEHVLDPKEYLLKIKQILKAGGVVYIGVPNEDSLFNSIKKIVFFFIGNKKIAVQTKPFDTPYHVVGFNKKSLRYILNTANLDILFLRNFGRKFNFLGHPPTKRGFWIGLFFLLPTELIGRILKKDVYYEAYVTKK